jgi:ribonuclease HI
LGIFYGANHDHPPLFNVGALMYISKPHFFTLRYIPGTGSNNKAEHVALWSLLLHTNMLQLRKLQVFGDSQVVVDWINGVTSFQVRQLHLIMRQVRDFIENMEWFSCRHILRELNEVAYKLSKEALYLEVGTFIIQEYFENQMIKEMNF